MHRQLFYVFIFFAPYTKSSEVNSYLATVEDGVEKFCYVSNIAARFLEDYNDRNLGKSELGMMLGYEEIKPKISHGGNERGLKKPMMLALLPLIFHVGAASTWMVLTSIMAVKSVAIGLILLVFKIAVSSAKMGSFFTQLKSKNAEPHIHTEYAWAPHGMFMLFWPEIVQNVRALPRTYLFGCAQLFWLVIPTHTDWTSHAPDWSHSSSQAYKTIPTYKENEIILEDDFYENSHKIAENKNG